MEVEERKWEDLNTYCLTNVFSKVGLKSLIFVLPLVCKSWYQVTLSPQSWKVLDFRTLSIIVHGDSNH
ncbi:hypothetical protein AQUCO_04300115v1 [Aquilegia coerulea]|uniref:F-box domain-containing protein n=1 Tax=Aquilegia coerulea TaxID=218851 RepID=A0A2G5CNP5_AQUCA|nr:hypothetical protein AQUCO_04300115v1 [Aquilegia coerulea]